MNGISFNFQRCQRQFQFQSHETKGVKNVFFQAFNIFWEKMDIWYWQCPEYPQYNYLKFKWTQNSQILLFWVDSYKTLERKTDVSLVEYLKLPILQNVPQKMLFVLKWRRNWQLLSPSFSVCRYWSLPARRRRSHYWPTFGPVGGGGALGGKRTANTAAATPPWGETQSSWWCCCWAKSSRVLLLSKIDSSSFALHRGHTEKSEPPLWAFSFTADHFLHQIITTITITVQDNAKNLWHFSHIPVSIIVTRFAIRVDARDISIDV